MEWNIYCSIVTGCNQPDGGSGANGIYPHGQIPSGYVKVRNKINIESPIFLNPYSQKLNVFIDGRV